MAIVDRGQEVSEAFVFGVLFALLLMAIWLLMRRQSTPPAAVWDERLRLMPQHTDLTRMYDRLGAVERVVEGMRGELDGVRQMSSRTEQYVKSLVDHHLRQEK